MIQAHDLRVGNLVNITSRDVTITALVNSIQREFITIGEDTECEYHLLHGIPLTQEILETRELLIGIPTHIKYLHQLQNLYYFLTGSEIKIQL